MPAQRRDGEGNRQVGSSWESLIDRQIREAMEQGAFADLPFQGQRLPIEDDSAAGEWAMAHRMLRNAGAAPPWIESDKEVRRLLAKRDELIARRDEPRRQVASESAGSRRRSSIRSIGRSPASTPRHRRSASTAARSTSIPNWCGSPRRRAADREPCGG